MFSKIDILNAMSTGDLVIEPFERQLLLPNSLKVRLDNELAITKKGRIDFSKTQNFEKFYKIRKLKQKEKFVLKPQQFILARTLESFALSKRISALVHGTSSLARIGLAATQTAPVIQAGHGVPNPRKIVLEINNNGPFDIVLSPGMIIGQLVFFRLDTPSDVCYDAFGKYGKRKEKDALTPVKE
jgi:deoxycytidine triphosphate deaminase